jgi:hypothetical protein
MVRSRSRNSLSAPQQPRQSVLSEPPRDRWDVDAIELLSKYGLTPQLEIWQKVGGSNCRTCEGQIKEFSKQVGWNMSSQVSPIPGEFPAQYPTVASLSWQSYVDSDKSITRYSLFAGAQTWQAWRVTEFNLFSTFANCGK